MPEDNTPGQTKQVILRLRPKYFAETLCRNLSDAISNRDAETWEMAAQIAESHECQHYEEGCAEIIAAAIRARSYVNPS